MKHLILLLTLVFSASAFATNRAVYEVTITNLTKGQPLTPPVLVAANSTFNLYVLGNEASPGLKYLAQDGKTQTLVDELSQNKAVSSHAVGSGVILPGQSDKIMLNANPASYLSLAAMLAKTNDGFFGKKKISLNLRRGQSIVTLANVYDAGAEINNESKDYIPGLGAHDVNTSESEGFVHPHPGVFGIADLNPLTDAFASVVAKITITRIK